MTFSCHVSLQNNVSQALRWNVSSHTSPVVRKLWWCMASHLHLTFQKKESHKVMCWGHCVCLCTQLLHNYYNRFLKHRHLQIVLNFRKLFTVGIAVHTFSICFVYTDQWASGQRHFFSYDIFVHGSKFQFIDGINLNLTHVCVCVVR